MSRKSSKQAQSRSTTRSTPLAPRRSGILGTALMFMTLTLGFTFFTLLDYYLIGSWSTDQNPVYGSTSAYKQG